MFLTVKHIPSRMAYHIIQNLNKAIKLYGQGGFLIHVILRDTYLENTEDKLVHLEMNI